MLRLSGIKIFPRLGLAVGILGLLLAVFTFPARAHAELVDSTPESNAALARSPAQVEILFSEPLEGAFSTIQVLDMSGARVDNDDSRVDLGNAARLTVSLRSLPDGVYTVSWKVLSAVDSHVTAGAFPFAVGQVDSAALGAAEGASRQIRVSPGEVVARWALYLSVAMLGGGLLFLVLVWDPVVRLDGQPVQALEPTSLPWRELSGLALIGLAAAAVLGLLVSAGQAAGREIAAPWNPAVYSVLFTTRFGLLWALRVLLAFLLAGLLAKAPGPQGRWLAFAGIAVLALTVSLGSHAAAEPRPFFPVLADWLHLLAASVWIGGLTHFAVGLRAIRKMEGTSKAALTSLLLPRFSSLALLSVGVLVGTGLYAAYLRIGSIAGLVGSVYGRVLLLKTLLAVGMISLGAVNLLRVTPQVKRASEEGAAPEAVNRLGRHVSLEIALGIFALLSVGLLTVLPPVQTASTSASVRVAAAADDLRLTLEITPGRVGMNQFVLRVTRDGQPLEAAREVTLRFTPITADLPGSEAVLSPAGEGEFIAEGANLSLADTWQIQAVVRRADRFDAYANFDLAIGAAAAPAIPWNRVVGVVLWAAALAYLYALNRLGHTPAQRWVAGALPAIALAFVGVAVWQVTPAAGERVLINPVPPNEVSIAAGEELYHQHCTACHGPAGRGDGPIGITLNPRPADLSLHTAPGVHPDGQLYEWITYGFEGAPMPAFDEVLGEEERWHLVNYIRTFATQDQP